MTLQLNIKSKIQAAQEEASDESTRLQRGLDEMIKCRSDGALYYLDRIWVPLKGNIRTLIIDEAHESKYSVHLGVDKMYYDLRDRYWWPRIKKDIAVYVSRCLTCLKVKAEHQRPLSLLQQPEIPKWKWERISMDFVTKLPRTSSGHDTIWAIIDQLTESAHFLPIREDYKMDRKPLEFSVGDYVLLKVSPWKGVISFGKKWKLAPRFVGPFEITKRIGPVAYRLRLPEELNGVHDTFYVSNLKKCLVDLTLQVPLDDIQVNAKLNLWKNMWKF
uniref:Putative reverse transcriptase domain-containing protein n=1 Tax=Tanacetum cinerariifolium TaxID=118510 RepID=A0A6L2MZN4_TANCI|nr:putative reverse transcriptase domain-containing protein [Tanacetum cinerariifolium]